MSKINQIQNQLRELSGGTFQKLADAYLHRKGEGICKKLKGDLDKCFVPAKTGISIEKVEEIIICHTSSLNTFELDSLREKCQQLGVNLNIFGIDTISYDLYQKYPGIARDFLGVEVDTGQVVTPDEFVTNYNKNALATPLDTKFHFRQAELEQVLQGLEESNLVIITGKAEVGKSRFVLEICKKFKALNPEYEVKCIFRRGPDIFDDLRVYFSKPGSHLIFVDDANRVNSFDYFIDLLQEQREDRQIKIIATVRDYAVDKVEEAAKTYGNWFDLEINSLEEKQIKQLVKDEYGIINPLYLDRIADISQGNPRLAIMAAKVAKQENKLQSINDVSSLYGEYYRSIREDLEELRDVNLLKTAAIVAFFQTVDRLNDTMIQAIETAFDISKENFWQAVCQLHEMELLDMYEKEVVKTSDQVLATYLFYLAFFEEKLVDFSVLLENFFPSLRYRLVDAINPVFNIFYNDKIIEIIRTPVDQLWEKYIQAGNEKDLRELIEVFWFCKQTDILLYVRDHISQMEAEAELVDFSNLDFNSNSYIYIPRDSLLNILRLFHHANLDDCRIALDLILIYLEKRPQEIAQVHYLLTKCFGFEPDSYIYDFNVQHTVIDLLLDKLKTKENQLFSKLFIELAQHYLKTQFTTSKTKDIKTINLITFDLPLTPKLIELRQKIWQQVFCLYQNSIFKEGVLEFLHEYSNSGRDVSVSKIIQQDAVEVLQFIQSKLDPSSYYHCLIVQEYLDFLEIHQVSFNQKLRGRFTNETYVISRVLIFNWKEREKLDLNSHEEHKNYKLEQIKKSFANYSLVDYKKFFEQCLEIRQKVSDINEFYYPRQYPRQIAEVLISLSNRDPKLYTEVIQHYLEIASQLKINEFPLVEKLLQILGTEKTYEFLNQTHYHLKRKWLFSFYCLLPQDEIEVKHIEQLYNLFSESDSSEMPTHFDFLLKYQLIDDSVIVRVTEIMLDKITEDSIYYCFLDCLFNLHTELNKNLTSLFKENLELLKKIYLRGFKLTIDSSI